MLEKGGERGVNMTTCDQQLAAFALSRGQILEQPHDLRDDALIERLAVGGGGGGGG